MDLPRISQVSRGCDRDRAVLICERRQTSKPGSAPAAAPATILVIEDDPTFLALMRMHLLWAGHAVQAASDPATGLRCIVESPPDLILLDLDLPYLSGFEVLEALRSDPVYRSIPVIIVTGHGDDQSYARCRALGVADYFTKPLESERLLEAIVTALAARSGK